MKAVLASLAVLCVAWSVAGADTAEGTCDAYADTNNVVPEQCNAVQGIVVYCHGPCTGENPGPVGCPRGEKVPEHDAGCQAGGGEEGCCFEEERTVWLHDSRCIQCVPALPDRRQCDGPCTGPATNQGAVSYSYNAPCGIDNPIGSDICEW